MEETAALRLRLSDETRSRVQLQQRLHHLLTALGVAPDGLAITARDGRFTFANPAQAAIFGLHDAAELLGQPWTVLFDKDEAVHIRDEIMPRSQADGHWRGRVCAIRKDGTDFPLEVTLSLLPDGGCLWLSRHVAGRCAVQVEEDGLAERLREADRATAVARSTRYLAHEFNNILSAIGSFATVAEMEGSKTDYHTSLERIQEAVQEGGEIANRMLSRGKRPVRHSQIDLIGLVAKVASMIEVGLPDGSHLLRRFAETALPMRADAILIGQAVMNLGMNAREALSGRAGSIEIMVECYAKPDQQRLHTLCATLGPNHAWISRGFLPKGRPGVFLAVIDTGLGMGQAALDHAFEPDFTTKGHGWGFGLPAVEEIVAAHDGDLTMCSRVGQGTICILRLPLDDREPATEGPASGQRILVVDDSPTVGESTVVVLEAAGYAAAWVDSGAAALDRLAQDADKCTAVLSDLYMRGMDGSVLAERIAERYPGIPVVLYSGEDDKGLAALTGKPGVAAVLGKPLRLDKLASILSQVIKIGRNEIPPGS
jgi:PAS domain S-box-containing protein